MIKEKIISKEITNASWGELIRQLEYKSKLKKVRLVKENRYYASSQICNKCGYKNEKLKDLSIREYICPKCNEEHNRDMNAAINIMRKGMKTILRQRLSPNSACGGYRL